MAKGYGGRIKVMRDTRGFTLIELMIVVIIIAALAAMVTPSLIGRSDEMKGKIAQADIATISLALKMFRLDNDYFPATDAGLDALMTKPATAGHWVGPYLENAPIDPWGRKYQYKYPGAQNASGYDLYSLGKDGVESPDDIVNWKRQ